MIKANEINQWIENANSFCYVRESCNRCPLVGKNECGEYCKWAEGEMTQKEVDMIAAYATSVDWSKVPIDTKVIVWENPEWKHRRYFAKYMDGKIYTFEDGATSWSHEPDCLMEWKYGRLAEDGDE